MFDKDNAAARRFYGAVRSFSATAKINTPGVIFLQVTPAECWDITKLSWRIYGSRHESLAVMAALGLDQSTKLARQKLGAFPTKEKLLILKRECGFESDPALRIDGAPIWRQD